MIFRCWAAFAGLHVRRGLGSELLKYAEVMAEEM